MYAKCNSLYNAQKMFDEMTERDLCSWNVLISGYAKMGLLDEARKMFDKMPERDNFSWTAMISGYVRHDKPNEALELCRMMKRHDNSKSNKFTISSALAAAAAVPCLRIGKEIHGHIMRTGLDSDEVVWSALSDIMYFEGGRRRGFDLFAELLRSRIRPNEFTFAGVLNACADLSDEEVGKQVHGHMTRIGFDPFSFAGSALVHMYSKCGNMVNAERVFRGMPRPDLVSWTSLIAGYAQNGHPNEP
ncbi:hypothetical protein GH714_031763 [Hevea brasiliensis]|uniref:Pentatricopeptide repeat-containing protein n=1 Tax=Hevea brasiliensis TaxID=3981 RepID=A0A6A6L3B5_HEVBR|nr:hypothetical protein GH714_031763 [Hevea brasiliensis]